MRISSNVVIKREIENDGKSIFKAYFRGTNNRVHYKDSGKVQELVENKGAK